MQELQNLAEALAARLGRAVAVDDPQFRLLTHTSHHGVVDAARTQSILERRIDGDLIQYALSFGLESSPEPWMRVPGSQERGLLTRVVAPLRAQGVLLGYLWIIEAGQPMTADDLADVTDVAHTAALILHRERLLLDVERGRDRERLRDLMADDVGVRTAAAHALREAGRVPQEEHLRVLLVLVSAGQDRSAELPQVLEDAMERVARRFTPPALAVARGNQGVLLLTAPDQAVEITAQAIRADVARQVPDVTLRTGAGDAASGLEDVHRSWRQARQAVRVAECFSGFPDDAQWSELGVYRLLVHMSLDDVPEDARPHELLELLETTGGRELARTVEAYLDSGGDARGTAEAMHLHRTSLYHRLNRFEALTGLELKRGQDRLAAHLGLKLARLTGRYPQE
ncbi:MAG: PucR family transcriptional regulator [Mycobacteriales bacterium]